VFGSFGFLSSISKAKEITVKTAQMARIRFASCTESAMVPHCIAVAALPVLKINPVMYAPSTPAAMNKRPIFDASARMSKTSIITRATAITTRLRTNYAPPPPLLMVVIVPTVYIRVMIT
jgi:hypothetical protein